MDKVVINFTEQGLEDIVSQLEKIGAIDAKQAAEFRQSNNEIKTRQQLIGQLFSNTSKGAKSMEDFAKATEKASKNIVSGATNEAIKKTNDLLDKTNEKYKKLSDSTLKYLAEQRKLAEEQRKNPPPTIPGIPPKLPEDTKKQISILRQLKQEYQELVTASEEAYAAGNRAFGDELQKKAGEVQDRIGDIRAATKAYASDTATFDAIGAGIRGIGAGFQIAQGAQALFGSSNEDLQKQLVKLQATMALVNGLTEIQNLLQKESALRIGLTNAQTFIQNALQRVGITIKTQSNVAEGTGEAIKKRVVVVQAIENGLTSQSVIVRGAATAAQWALNNAMLAFPLVAIIAGLVAVVGLINSFGESLNEAAESQIYMNEVQKENMKIMQEQDNYINKFSQDLADKYQREIDLLKAKGASTELIRIKENQLQQERNRNAQYQFGNHLIEVANLEKNRLAVIGLTASLAAYNKAKAETGDDDFDKTIEALKGKLEIVQELVRQGEEAQKNQQDAVLETAIFALEKQKEIELEGLAFQKDVITAKLRFAKEGGEQQLALQLSLAKNERDTAIANLKADNQSRADIEAAYEEKRLQIIEAYNTVQLQKKRSLVEAELAQVRIGSQAELDLKLKALEIENKIELNNRKLTDEKRKEITAKYLRQTQDMVLDFAKKQRDDEINAQLLINDARMKVVEKGSEDEYKLKQQRIALEEQLELNNIDRNIQGTELGEAKKNNIIATYADKNKQLQIDAINVVITARENENKRIAEVLQARADLEANNVNTSIERRQQLELEAFDNSLTLLKKEEVALGDKYLAGIITFEEYQKELTRIQDEEINNRLAKQNAADAIELENLKRKTDRITQLATDTATLLNNINDTYLQNQLQRFDEESRNNEDLHNRKVITDQQYTANKIELDKKIAKEKREAAEREKAIALIQILINTASSIIKTGAEMGYPAAIPFQVLAGALGAIQYAAVASKQIPGYEKGTENAPKGWAWVGEKGPELIWMQGGEKVKPHKQSIEMARSYNQSLRQSFAERIDRSPVPSKAAEIAMERLKSNTMGIDIASLSKMIGNEIGEHISRMPLTLMSFDRNGFQASIVQGNTTTTFLNSRYSSN